MPDQYNPTDPGSQKDMGSPIPITLGEGFPQAPAGTKIQVKLKDRSKLNDDDYMHQLVEDEVAARYGPRSPAPDVSKYLPVTKTWPVSPSHVESGQDVQDTGVMPRLWEGIKSGVSGLMSTIPGHAGGETIDSPRLRTATSIPEMEAALEEYQKQQEQNAPPAALSIPGVAQADQLYRGDYAGLIGSALPLVAGEAATSPRIGAPIAQAARTAMKAPLSFRRGSLGGAGGFGLGTLAASKGGLPEGWAIGGVPGAMIGNKIEEGIRALPGAFRAAENEPWFKKPGFPPPSSEPTPTPIPTKPVTVPQQLQPGSPIQTLPAARQMRELPPSSQIQLPGQYQMPPIKGEDFRGNTIDIKPVSARTVPEPKPVEVPKTETKPVEVPKKIQDPKDLVKDIDAKLKDKESEEINRNANAPNTITGSEGPEEKPKITRAQIVKIADATGLSHGQVARSAVKSGHQVEVSIQGRGWGLEGGYIAHNRPVPNIQAIGKMVADQLPEMTAEDPEKAGILSDFLETINYKGAKQQSELDRLFNKHDEIKNHSARKVSTSSASALSNYHSQLNDLHDSVSSYVKSNGIKNPEVTESLKESMNHLNQIDDDDTIHSDRALLYMHDALKMLKKKK